MNLTKSIFDTIYSLYISNGYYPCQALNETIKFLNKLETPTL